MDVREKLVELLCGCPCESDCEGMIGSCPNRKNGNCNEIFKLSYCAVSKLAQHLIANGVTVQEWISVNDRLPEAYDKEPDWSVTVLFRTIQGHIHSGYRNIGRSKKSFYDDDWTPPYWLDDSENLTFEEDEVTHWQYLPQPPKGE